MFLPEKHVIWPPGPGAAACILPSRRVCGPGNASSHKRTLPRRRIAIPRVKQNEIKAFRPATALA